MKIKGLIKKLTILVLLSLMLLPVSRAVSTNYSNTDNEETYNPIDEPPFSPIKRGSPDWTNMSGPPDWLNETQAPGWLDEIKRDVLVDKHKGRLDVSSEWVGEGKDDRFELRFQTSPIPSFSFEYQKKSNGHVSDVEFMLELEEIIEYIDENGNSRFDSNDDKVGSYNFSDVKFKEIEHDILESEDEEIIHEFFITTDDDVFGMMIYIGNSFMQSESDILAPTSVKIDFIINYEYGSPDSKIALKLNTRTEHNTQIEGDTYDEKNSFAKDETGISIFDDNVSAFFSWSDYARVDDIRKAVRANIISQIEIDSMDDEKRIKREETIYLSYERGEEDVSNIVHDPKIGVISESLHVIYADKPEDMMFLPVELMYVIFSLIAGALFISGIFVRKRK